MFKKGMSALNWLVLIGLIICNIVLIKQNIELRETVERQEREKRVQVGDRFGEFTAFDNKNESVNFISNKPTKNLILFSSTTCPFCNKQNPYWIQLAKQINAENYKIYMLFNDDEEIPKVEQYLEDNGFTIAENQITVLFSDNEMLQKYKLNGTPTTLVVNESGTVEKSWSGLWDKTKISEAENYFHIVIN